MQSKHTPLPFPGYALFVGSIYHGFKLESVIFNKDAAEQEAIKHLANGKLAEFIEIKRPSSIDRRVKDSDAGTHYAVLGRGLANGFTIYGPFEDEEAGEEFGESHRDGDDWEIFTITTP